MTAFERAIKVIMSCETEGQLLTAYKYYRLACKWSQSRKMEAKEYWETVTNIEDLFTIHARKIRAGRML